MKKSAYVHNVDELIADTSLDSVLVYFGISPTNQTSGEYRMACVFNENCRESSYGQLAISAAHPAKQIFCHVCGTRGNLLTLIHGLETHQPPATGKLRGQEFKDALAKLKEIRGIGTDTRVNINQALSTPRSTAAKPSQTVETTPVVPKRNVPLQRHENEAARKIADLHNDLVTDLTVMSPGAAQYVRSRPWMTAEMMNKWGVGYLPRDGRSMFRGLFVYTHRNAAGDVISYSARDPHFEEKQQAWLRQGETKASRKPIKHKYVKGFARGLELYGQQTARLEEANIHASLDRYGLIVVEGANDVIALDNLGLAAVGLCSNRATNHQIEKIERFAQQAAAGRVTLLPDNDDEGEAGFRELLWSLVDRGLDVKLGWSSARSGGQYAGMQPEEISTEIWAELNDNSHRAFDQSLNPAK
jgi:5S rRNA maturation endonuclease (ribonuclease M5)